MPGRFGLTGQIISSIKHRDKGTNNALIAKAVEVCEKAGLEHLVYLFWSEDSLSEFKRRCGFERTLVPRYFVPLTSKGRLGLAGGRPQGMEGDAAGQREGLPEAAQGVVVRVAGRNEAGPLTWTLDALHMPGIAGIFGSRPAAECGRLVDGHDRQHESRAVLRIRRSAARRTWGCTPVGRRIRARSRRAIPWPRKPPHLMWLLAGECVGDGRWTRHRCVVRSSMATASCRSSTACSAAS